MGQLEVEQRQSLAEAITYSVVIPVYNSATMLEELHGRLTNTMQDLGKPYEIIFVEDCGPDHAWDVLERLAAADEHTTAIQLMHNSGQSSATLCGMANADGQFIITMDDDLQHPPEELPLLIDAMNPNYDVVMGVPREKQHPLFRRLGSSFIHFLNCRMLGKDRSLRFTSFRVIRRPVVEGLLSLRTLSPALGPMLNSITRRIGNVVVQHHARKEGRSGFTVRRIFQQTMSNLVGYSMLPLRVLAIAGIVGISCSIALALVLLVRYMMGDITVPGWTSTALLLVVLSGFNFFAFAVLGEYVLRILQQVNWTPQYLVRNKTGPWDEPVEGAGKQSQSQSQSQ